MIAADATIYCVLCLGCCKQLCQVVFGSKQYGSGHMPMHFTGHVTSVRSHSTHTVESNLGQVMCHIYCSQWPAWFSVSQDCAAIYFCVYMTLQLKIIWSNKTPKSLECFSLGKEHKSRLRETLQICPSAVYACTNHIWLIFLLNSRKTAAMHAKPVPTSSYANITMNDNRHVFMYTWNDQRNAYIQTRHILTLSHLRQHR